MTTWYVRAAFSRYLPCLWAAEEAAHVAFTGTVAHTTHAYPAAEALRALGELVRVLLAFAIQRPPLARAAAHVAYTDVKREERGGMHRHGERATHCVNPYGVFAARLSNEVVCVSPPPVSGEKHTGEFGEAASGWVCLTCDHASAAALEAVVRGVEGLRLVEGEPTEGQRRRAEV